MYRELCSPFKLVLRCSCLYRLWQRTAQQLLLNAHNVRQMHILQLKLVSLSLDTGLDTGPDNMMYIEMDNVMDNGHFAYNIAHANQFS